MSLEHPLLGADRALRTADAQRRGNRAYRRHLARHGIDPDQPLVALDDFRRLPPTTKANYRNAEPLADLVVATAFSADTISESSGSSGSPTFWPRDRATMLHCAAMFDACLRELAQTDDRPTLVVVTFPLGPYVGGTLMYDTLLELHRRGHRILIATPGMDVDAVGRVIVEAEGLVEQVVIMAYPPVARDILDRPDIVEGRDIKLILGGEPMSEIVRERNHALLGDPDGDRIRVVYGATDVGFIGYETTATVAIRRAAVDDAQLNATVFGLEDEGAGQLVHQPAFVQYRPEATYLEPDEDGYLLFTVDGVLPLVRYRVNDRGDVLRGAQVYERLVAAHRPDLAAIVDQTGTFLLIHGRTDIAAIISGANIYPDYLRPAVEHISLATRLTGDFYFRPAADVGDHADVDLVAELREGHESDAETAEHLRQLVIASLRQLSAEYRIVHNNRGAVAEPQVVLVPFGSDGFDTHGKSRTVQQL